jgi:hypothetical protein
MTLLDTYTYRLSHLKDENEFLLPQMNIAKKFIAVAIALKTYPVDVMSFINR